MLNKKILTSMVVAGGLGFGSVGVAFAQPVADAPLPPPPQAGDMMPPPPPPPPHRHMRMFGPEVGPLGMIFQGIKFTKEQKNQIRTIIKKARTEEFAAHKDLDAMHEQIGLALLQPGKVTAESLKTLLDKQSTLEQANKDRHLKTILALRDVLTPEQLATAKTRYTKLQSIRKQMRELHQQMRELNGHPQPPMGDAPPPPADPADND